MYEIIEYGNLILIPLLLAACAVAMLLKFGASVAGILGAVGFGVEFLLRAFFSVVRLLEIRLYDYDWPEAVFFAVEIVMWLGWACVAVALFLVPRSPRARTQLAVAPGAGPVTMSGYHRARPGWGLAIGWIVCSALSFLFGLVFLAMYVDAGSRVSEREWEGMFPVVVLMFLMVIPTTILLCMWLYQAWSAVPAKFRSTTPGRAVGFLFIPFFNFYWIFRAVPGLSASVRRATNSVSRREASSASYGIGIAAAVVNLVPYVNVVSWILYLLWVIFANVEKNRMIVLFDQLEEAHDPDERTSDPAGEYDRPLPPLQ